jgi:hypothetical protein
MYYSKIHRRGRDVVLAVCDAEVHNKTFENEKLSFFVDPFFYGKKGISEEELVEFLEEANIINLAGKMCVDLAIKSGYVEPENVLEVGGCSHAQVVRI